MNTALLKSSIVKAGYSYSEFFSKIEMTKKEWYSRLSGKVEFKHSEIIKIVETLSLTDEEIINVFFNPKVS